MGTACADCLRFVRGMFLCSIGVLSVVLPEEPAFSELSAASVDFLQGKKHLKMPSACHLVAFVKLTHTSMRPGRLRAGSRRSMWFVVANSNLKGR